MICATAQSSPLRLHCVMDFDIRRSVSNEALKRDFRRIAAEQHGVITRRQLLQAGMRASWIDRRVAAGDLIPVGLGVYLLSGSPLTWEAKLMAASVAFDPPAPLSHRSAAALWDLEGFSPGPVEVTTTNTERRIDGKVHRAQCLDRAQVTRHKGWLVTTPNQTLLDLGAVVHSERVAAALDSALLQGLTSLQYLAKHLDRFGGRGKPGTGVISAFDAGPPEIGPHRERARAAIPSKRGEARLSSSPGVPVPDLRREGVRCSSRLRLSARARRHRG